jgi:hypothetical protein
MSNLFEISKDYKELLEKIEFLLEKFNEENKYEIKAHIDCLLWELDSKDNDLNNKFDNYAYIIRSKNDENGLIDQEIKRLQKRKKRNNNVIERLKSFLKLIISNLNKTKIETNLNTIAIRKNPQKVEILDNTAIPYEYKEEIITEKILKNKLKEALKAGDEIPGCTLIQTERIDIK